MGSIMVHAKHVAPFCSGLDEVRRRQPRALPGRPWAPRVPKPSTGIVGPSTMLNWRVPSLIHYSSSLPPSTIIPVVKSRDTATDVAEEAYPSQVTAVLSYARESHPRARTVQRPPGELHAHGTAVRAITWIHRVLGMGSSVNIQTAQASRPSSPEPACPWRLDFGPYRRQTLLRHRGTMFQPLCYLRR
jgi:hypothetical protein